MSFISLLLASLFISATALALPESELDCTGPQTSASVSLPEDATITQYVDTECNGGEGDDFQNCADVTYTYEEKLAVIRLNVGGQPATVTFKFARLKDRAVPFTGTSAKIPDADRALEIALEGDSISAPKLSLVWFNADGNITATETLACRSR